MKVQEARWMIEYIRSKTEKRIRKEKRVRRKEWVL